MSTGPDTDPEATATAGHPTQATAMPGRDAALPVGAALHADPRRYELGAVLGRGGMGEVIAARDRDIGREVAIKRMRRASPSSDAMARFLREARVQGRLEHPAIPPVHDLGIDEHGRPYFAMKRLAGRTLRELIGAPEARPRLLRAFAEVCLAVELAHVSGVVHRDLKPSNIMLGEFGEVYVIDWGVARVRGDDDPRSDERGAGSRDTPLGSSDEPVTEPGAVLGTPGYMAPEQRRGEPDIGPAADVFALGAILFEILTATPLLTRDGAVPADLDARPSARGHDVAPELEAACVAATAPAAADRPTARALGEQVQRYLDGDRDQARRAELAAGELATAERALAAGDRATAMRHAGRALALDPTSPAAALISRLVLEPPPTPPPEVTALLAARDRDTITRQGFLAARSLATSAIVVAFLAYLFVGSAPLTIAIAGGFLASAAHAYVTSVRDRGFRRRDVAFILASNAAFLILLSRIFGVYLIVPAIATAALSGIAVLPPLIDAYHRVWAVFAGGLVAPVALELAGVWDRTTAFGERGITVAPLATSHPRAAELLMLAAVLALLYAGGRYVRALARANRAAEARLELQAWHLRQLMPPAP